MPPIRFHRVADPYGELANFAPYPILLGGARWPTSEHYFQAQKFVGTPHEEEIRTTTSPMVAARKARNRSRPLRPDWERVRNAVMLRAVDAKFSQHPALGALLLGTGDEQLVEHTPKDRYWGDGGDGSGRNQLGRTLMEVRADLRRRAPAVALWRSLLRPGRGWVLFEPDTVVVTADPVEGLVASAVETLARWGPVHPASPQGDFSVSQAEDGATWVISFDHPDILSVLSEEEAAGMAEVVVGLTGRGKRDEAAAKLRVLHVEPGDGSA